MKTNFLKTFYLAMVLLLSLPFESMAQFNPPDPQTDVDLPLDGGVGFLLAAGIGYGVKKIRDERKRRKAA